MKFKLKLLLGLSLLGGLLSVYFADENMTAKKEQQKQEHAVALYFENKDCIKFSIQNAQGTFVFERQDFQSPWYMVSPKQLMADQDSVNTLLVSLRNIGVQRELSTDNNLNHYGLDTPVLHFEITLKNKKTKALSFGKNINETESAYHLPSVYAQVTGRPILVVDNSSIPSFNEKTYSDFRTKNVAHFKTEDVAHLTIIPQLHNTAPQLAQGYKTEMIELAKNKEWLATAPTATPANGSFVSKYLATLQELTADNIIEPPSENLLKTKGVNLKNPTASITLKGADGKSLQEITLYMTKSNVFINMPDGAFAQVALEKWPDLVPKFKYFRNRSVMLGTNSECDSDLESLVADDVIDNVSPVDVEKFGFQKPLKTFTCSVGQKETKDSKKLEVIIGNHVPLNEKSVYVKRSDSNTVYIVNSESLSKLAEVKPL